MLRPKLLGFAACAMMACAVPAFGAFSADYGDMPGATVDYLQIKESNSGASALFGAPSITGDVMDFDPDAFSASSSGAAVSVDGKLNFIVMSKSSTSPISTLILKEKGDFTLVGLGNALAQATVGTAVHVNVLEVNGLAQFVDGGSHSMVFTPNANGEFALPADAGTAVPWSGYLAIDLSGIAAGATKVEVVLDNVLTATAANGGTARIAKKDLNGLTITVPEPATGSLFLVLALAGAGLRRRSQLV